MSQPWSDPNPYEAPQTEISSTRAPRDDSQLTTVDWLICIFCSGIGCIIGIFRLVQGKPSGGKMLGLSLFFAVLWGILRVLLESAMEADL